MSVLPGDSFEQNNSAKYSIHFSIKLHFWISCFVNVPAHYIHSTVSTLCGGQLTSADYLTSQGTWLMDE